jgi:hypothetical protein
LTSGIKTVTAGRRPFPIFRLSSETKIGFWAFIPIQEIRTRNTRVEIDFIRILLVFNG